MSGELLPAIIGVTSAAVTAAIGGGALLLRDYFRDSRQRRQASKERQFNNLYRPLYRLLTAGGSLAEGRDGEGLAMILSGAGKTVKENLDVAPAELLDRMYNWDELVFFQAQAHEYLDTEIKWLYQHVNRRFTRLQKDLKLTD